MDAAEGLPVTTIDDEAALRHFGCKLAELPRRARRLIAVRAGGRAGKTSRMLATKALHAALTVPLPTLGHGERAVALLIAPDLVLARQILGFVRGYTDTSPRLRAMVLRDTADEIEVRRADGQAVLIRVRAASRGGKGGRGFVFVFAGLDEAAFFRDESSGVVNDTEIYRPIAQRLAPGAQAWITSTPWVANMGLLEETIAADFGRHEHALCAVAPTRALNPTWDPDGTIEAGLRESDPENADREIGAIPLTAGTHNFFSHDAIEQAFKPEMPQQSPPRQGATCGAGGDTGFTKNSSALAIVERIDGKAGAPARFKLVRLEERKPAPGLPLQPKAVARDFADIFLPYGTRELVTDAHEIADVRAALLEKNCTVVVSPPKTEAFTFARTVLHESRLDLPKHPRLRNQLRAILAKPMPGGGVQIKSPTAADGSHGDLVSALVNALWRASLTPAPKVAPQNVPVRVQESF